MGTYTDLLKLNKGNPPRPNPVEQSIEETVIKIEPLSEKHATVWQSEAKEESLDRQIAISPNSEIAETPHRQVAKSPNRKSQKRAVLHRGMDIYRDQLQALSRIQFALWRRDDRKPSIRELVLLAIDNYIEKMKSEMGEK